MPDEKTKKNTNIHGHAVLNVGNPGNKGGTGRPPNDLRLKSRALFEMAIARAVERLESGEMADSDLLRALEVGGKYGLGPAAPEQVAPEGEAIRLTMDARVKHDDETSD